MSKYAFISEVNSLMGNQLNDDLFLFSKGSEDRSYNVINHYYDFISPKQCIMFDSRLRNESLPAKEMSKYNSIETLIEQRHIQNIKTISVETPYISGNILTEEISPNTSVSVDISSMNFWELSDLICFLLTVRSVQRINIFYTEPDLYHYENDDIAQYDHAIPRVSINYIKGYYSTNTIDEEILVSMIGFQRHVNKLVKDMVEVSQYYSVNGFPSFYPKAKDISQVNNDDYLSEIIPANRYSAEAINPFVTYNTLLAIRKASHDSYMNICPLCSKPMAVGACLYAIKNPLTTRIIYPFEATVSTKTDGIGRTFCYSVLKDFLE